MANNPSARKRIRHNQRRADINGARRGRIRTFIKKVESAIGRGDAEEARSALKQAQPELQRGVAKGIFHQNTAARKLSRLSRRVKEIGQESSPSSQ